MSKRIITLSSNVKLDVPALIQATALLGIKGAGKSYLAQLIAERCFDIKLPWIAVDPIGVWRWLRVPGAGNGYPVVVAGGEGADIPLTVATAPAIVEAAMAANVCLVLDLFDLSMSKADWRKIVKDVFTLLLHKNKEPRHVFLEEAAEFIPQQLGRSDVDGMTYAAVEKLARMGGNRRLGITLINQRAEEVNKAVLELCDNLFLFRQKGKNSIASLDKWLSGAGTTNVADVIKGIPMLAAGECFAWLSGSDTPVHLYVPTKTSYHPNRNEVHKKTRKRSVPVDKFVKTLTALLPELEKAVKANDVPSLTKRINAMERENAALVKQIEKLKEEPTAQGPTKAQRKAELKTFVQDFFRAEVLPWQKDLLSFLDNTQGELRARVKKVASLGRVKDVATFADVKKVHAALPPQKTARELLGYKKPIAVGLSKTSAGRVAKQVIIDDIAPDEAPDITPYQQRILDSIGWWNGLGITPTRIQIACRMKQRVHGNFNNQIGNLRTKGLIEYPEGGTVAFTEAGMNTAKTSMDGDPFDCALDVCSVLQKKMLQELRTAARTMSREELAEAIGQKVHGNFNNQLGNLRTLGFIRYPDKGSVQLVDWLRE